jgi:hypothetical protein
MASQPGPPHLSPYAAPTDRDYYPPASTSSLSLVARPDVTVESEKVTASQRRKGIIHREWVR